MRKQYAIILLAAAAFVLSCQKNTISDDSFDPDSPVTYQLRQGKSPKRGVSFNFGSLPDTDIPLLGNAVTWSYDWSSRVPSEATQTLFAQFGMDWCPMIWNGNYDPENIRTWKRTHPEAQYILAFNEPNLKDQANMTPAQAAALWPNVVSLAQELGMKLISPALNYGTLPDYHDPIKWMDEFLAQPGVSLDQIDGIALHCYMPSAASVKNFIDMFKKYGKPIWLTEFCNGNSDNISEDAQLRYMCETVNMLEAHENVFRYAWFMPRGGFNSKWHNNLLTSKAPFELTTLGTVFVNFPTYDKSVVYKSGELIPAEQYSAASYQVHLAPSTDKNGGVLEISELPKDGWVEYKLSIPSAGAHKVYLRYKTYRETSLAVSLNGAEIAVKKIPSTDKEWVSSYFTLDIPAGESTLRLTGNSGATLALNWLMIR